MNQIENIFQRCHERHAEKDILRQRKTVLTPSMNKRIPYNIKVHFSRANPITTDALERAEISFMPTGHAPENEKGPTDFGGQRFNTRQRTQDWQIEQWYNSWGVQIYTGIPSKQGDAYWHDLEFSYHAIRNAPEYISTCIQTLLNIAAAPLLTLTKTGGLRFSCRIQNYLHPDTDTAKFIFHKSEPSNDNTEQNDIYLQIQGDRGYSQWDMRYEILCGDVLNPPIITPKLLFVTVDNLREKLHQTGSTITPPERNTEQLVSFRSDDLELAKEALLKRGYTFFHEENGFYRWVSDGRFGSGTDVFLWEDREVVWVRGSSQNSELPMMATQITEIWDDTGISPKTVENGIPINDRLIEIRDAKLSPLAIKRAPKAIEKPDTATDEQQNPTEQQPQQQVTDIINSTEQITAISTTEINMLAKTETIEAILNEYPISINEPNATEKEYGFNDKYSISYYRPIATNWEKTKDIPIDVRLEKPFEHGNVCEFPEQYTALKNKGVNPEETFCLQCPVSTACKERGYLSQTSELRDADIQILSQDKLFFDPIYADFADKVISREEHPHRVCIIDEHHTKITDLFVEYRISKEVIEAWEVNWKGSDLGNFATTLINIVRGPSEFNRNLVGQVRTAVEAFSDKEDEIITQMCNINAEGPVISRKTVDPVSKEVLSEYIIDFPGDATFYIPSGTIAEQKLRDMNLETVTPPSFTSEEVISLPMHITDAIKYGIHDLDDINAIPTLCQDPNWTYWHQLKYFFAHYKHDAGAPMRWADENLVFWIPPKVHPGIKKLIFVSNYFSEQDIRTVFSHKQSEVVRMPPIEWQADNRVFQLRSQSRKPYELLNYGINGADSELSIIGERYFAGIKAEIEKDAHVKHAIITHKSVIENVLYLQEKPNVTLITDFKSNDINDSVLEQTDVIWIVGTVWWSPPSVWLEAQMLLGSVEEDLSYEGEFPYGEYEDERMRGFYDKKVVGLLTYILGQAGLNRANGKTAVLLTNTNLPNITDKPETVHFDWEDFEVAGGLEKLTEVVKIREQFEVEQGDLTENSSRVEVERVLGCSSRQANRVLNKLRGGNIPRVSFRDQILYLLSSGRERTTSSLVAAIDSSPQAIGNELKRLLDSGEIVRVKRGVYSLPTDKT